jgi:hypothetical protein
MVYCDLWYGGEGIRGWDTERGRIVLRYGIPWSDASFLGGYSRFNVLEYRDFEFVFEDITRGGHFTMYSPKASAASSWTNDYVIQAAEMAQTHPEQYDPKLTHTVELIVAQASFRGIGGVNDHYVQVFVPTVDSTEVGRGTVGVFAMDTSGRVLDESIVRLRSRGDAGSVLAALETPLDADAVVVEYLTSDRLLAGKTVLEGGILSFSGDTLSVSDIVLASEIDDASSARDSGDRGKIVRSEYVLRPLSRRSVASGEDILVYFEMYGLETDSGGVGHYKVDVALIRDEPKQGLHRLWSSVFGDTPPSRVAASVRSTSAGRDESRFIAVALPSDAGGRYQLVLEVTDLKTNHRVTRSRSVIIDQPAGY